MPSGSEAMDGIGALIRSRLDGPGDDAVIEWRGRSLPRAWLRAQVDEIQRALDGMGIGPDQPVGVAPHTTPLFVAALLALFERQQPITMLYTYQSAEALARKVDELRLPVLIAAREQWSAGMSEAALRQGTGAIALEDGEGAITVLQSWQPRAGQRHPDAEPGVELLTSGTTGPPKLFPLSYRKLLARTVLNNTVASRNRWPALLFFPLGNIAGIYNLMGVMAADNRMILIDKWQVEPWLAYVREVRPAITNLPPAAFRMILDAGVEPRELEAIRFIATGAATLAPALRREFEARYAPRILQSYGATEFGGVVASYTPDLHAQFGAAKADSVGRPFGGASLRIVDVASGAPLPPGTQGRLEVLAPVMTDDWIATTDLALIDADGFLYHCGRLDGAIVRGGFKIIPEQVADALAEHPAVGTAAVVGLAHERLGQVPVAAFEVRGGMPAPDADELERHLRERLPATMVPVRFRAVAALPRTPSLKVDTAAVRALFGA